MSKFLLRLSPAVLLFLSHHALAAFFRPESAPCPDSLRLHVFSVQCYGLRNGIIEVDTVFGGVRPFYFSIDGQSFSTNPVFDHLWPGVYTVFARDATGCVSHWQVTVPEPEELQVVLIADADTVAEGETVGLKASVAPEGIPLSAIEWRPPDLFSRHDTLFQKPRITETTTFAIEIRTAGGCIARDQATVEVEKTNIYIPNVIKPGSNQDAYFTLFSGEGIARIVEMRVYSRGGGLVFERKDFSPNDPIKGWNGRWQGKYVQSGVYPWIVVVEYLDGRRKQLRGNVTVVN